MDYYSYAPLVRLERPVALCGLPGAAVGRTARAVTLVSGLPLVWVDRQVEHRLGRSVELVELEQGIAARHAEERVVIGDALRQPSPRLLALTSVTFLDGDLVRRLEREADLVLLHVDVETALARVLAEGAEDPRRHWALRDGGRATPAQVHGRLTELAQRMRHLSRVVLVQDRPPLEVAQQVARGLGLDPST